MIYALVFVAATVLALLLTRLTIAFAHRRGLLDLPSPRRIHTNPTPRIGGAAMYGAFSLVLLALLAAGEVGSYDATALLLGAGALTLVGFVDDIWGLDARTKFLFQLAAALIAVVGFDIAIRGVSVPLVGRVYLEGSLVGYAVTVLWILGMINTVNFADGIDGLAGGLAVIFSLVLFLVGLAIEQRELPLYACALGGVALGFLRYNFAPARIFMGDSGSYFLGFTMALLSVLGSAKLATGLLVMGIWVADVAYSIYRRMHTGTPIEMPDKEHLHHRFIAIGLSQRTTALLFYALALAFGSAGLIGRREGRLAALVTLGLLSLLIIWFVNRRLSARNTEVSVRDR